MSLSYDSGRTFTVIKSFIGGCPLTDEYEFQIPLQAPQGIALFSWSWINNVGNRDFYQNCAWVEIQNSKKATQKLSGAEMFVANLQGHCMVPEGYDFVYPNVGPDVEYGGDVDFYTDICANKPPFRHSLYDTTSANNTS